jgi:oligopeptide transport system permease protein
MRFPWIALLLGISVLGGVLMAPWISPFPYDQQHLDERLLVPNGTYWMGTDSLGRDLFSRILHGGRMSLGMGLGTTCLTLLFGTFFGMLAGYFGGWTNRAFDRITEALLIFPSLLLAILLTVAVGRGFFGLVLAMSVTAWVPHARMVRNQIQILKQSLLHESAVALGCSNSRILIRHLLPQLTGSQMVSFSLILPQQILVESFLSFMGLGLPPPHASWGGLAHEGMRALEVFPHLIIFPGAFLYLTLQSIQTLSDHLNILLDPRLRTNVVRFPQRGMGALLGS